MDNQAEGKISPAPGNPAERRIGEPENLDQYRLLVNELEAYHFALQVQYQELLAAKTELEVSRDRYAQLFHEAPIGYLIVDKYDLIVDANPAALEMLGITRAAMKSRPLFRHFHTEDIERYQSHRDSVAGKTSRAACELRLRPERGSEIHVLLGTQVLPEVDRPAGTTLVTLTNITSLKETERQLRQAQAELQRSHQSTALKLDLSTAKLAQEIASRRATESALRETEHKYELVVENANEAIAVGQDGVFRFANRRLAELLGRPAEELLSDQFINYIHPDDRDMVMEQYRAYLNGTGDGDFFDVRVISVDGQIHWLRANAAPIEWNGAPAVLGSLTDITYRREIEIQLGEERRLLKTILDNIPAVVCLYDLEENVYYVNPEFARLYGWTLDDLRQPNVMSKLFSDPTVHQEIRKFAAAVTAQWQDIGVTTKSGGIVETSWRNIVLPDGLHIGMGIDVTERKKAELNLRDANRLLAFERTALERKNVALKELIAQFETRKKKIEDTVAHNIEKTILPILAKVKKRAGSSQIQLRNLDLIERELKNIISPFGANLQRRFSNLTKREKEVCRLIAHGMTTTQIGDKLGLSCATVQKYRELIRRKLELTGSRMNLDAYLSNLTEDET